MSFNPWIHLPPITADTPVDDVRNRILTELSGDRLGNVHCANTVGIKVNTTAEYADPNLQFSYKNGVAIGPNAPSQLVWVAAISASLAVIIMTTIRSLPFPRWVLFPFSFAACYGLFRLIPNFHRKITIDFLGHKCAQQSL